jgi:hypothetical protein
MIRQNPAADGDRPHFYSEYWINVALGKPSSVEAAAPAALAAFEPEIDLDLEPPLPAPVRPEPVRPVKKAPEKKPEPTRLSTLADLANIEELMKSSAAMTDDVVPDFTAETALAAEPPISADFNLAEAAAEPVAEEGAEPFEEYEFEEEEEEDEWGGRRPGKGGSKKPTKPQKPPRRREF